MSDESDSNYISVWSWMWMMFVTALPCIGLVMVFVWAFTGNNESRKNYFRAVLAWFVVAFALVAVLALVGQLPQILKHFEDLTHKK
jgi:heme/copper-type cytochrome/quinol oxidase subunit 2